MYMLTTFFVVGKTCNLLLKLVKLNVNVLQRNHNRSRRFEELQNTCFG